MSLRVHILQMCNCFTVEQAQALCTVPKHHNTLASSLRYKSGRLFRPPPTPFSLRHHHSFTELSTLPDCLVSVKLYYLMS